MRKTTIMYPFTLGGKSIHTGQVAAMEIRRGTSGILFVRRVRGGSKYSIRAIHSNIVCSERRTVLGRDGITVATVEHVLAALYGMGIDCANVMLDGWECPNMGGSVEFLTSRLYGNTINMNADREYIRLDGPIVVEGKGGVIEASPGDDLFIEYEAKFDNPIGEQYFGGKIDPETFQGEIAGARTFGFTDEIAELKRNGFSLGSNPGNAIFVDRGGSYQTKLRWEDECVRHKVMDLIGDLALLGKPLLAHINAYKTGHALHHKFVREVVRRDTGKG